MRRTKCMPEAQLLDIKLDSSPVVQRPVSREAAKELTTRLSFLSKSDLLPGSHHRRLRRVYVRYMVV